MTKEQAIKVIYESLKPVQKEMFQNFFKHKGLKYVAHCSRRLGKTYWLCALALVYAINRKDSQIKYASVTQKAVKQMIHPIMKELNAKLSPKYKGVWNSQDGAYRFANGSRIYVAGVNNGHADDLRGTAAHLAIVDEAGFCEELDYLVSSVLIQQLISTGGKLVVASSSPLSPAHEFAAMILEARQEGNYSSYDIHSAGYDEATVELFIKESGGRQSTSVRREYFNELIVDDSMAVVPEWNDSFIVERTPSKYDKFYHRYESMDLGVRDKTAVLFGTYCFDKATLYVEAEWTASGQDSTTRNIAENVLRIEKELGYSNVYQRVADNNALITLQDLNNEFGLYFGATSKDSLAAMVNELRLWVSSNRLKISPKCPELIACLKYGVYNDDKRKEFGRSKVLGHYDALASLVYLVRNIDQHTNPLPANLGATRETQFVVPEPDSNEDILKIFNIK